jgi:hypothetical protein
MKTLSMIKEGFNGNPIGVTNHLTPVDNIVTNVRNFFSPKMSLVVSKGEDNISLKCTSSLFTSEEQTRNMLYFPYWNDRMSLASYVSQQGLSQIKVLPIGQEFIVYFCPADMPQLGYGSSYGEKVPCCGCDEQRQYHLGEVEFVVFEDETQNVNQKYYGQGDQEIEGIQKKNLHELLNDKDKVKAAKAFAEILKQNMRLPENVYIKAVRDEDGNESVALRYRYEKRKPFGKTSTMTKTLVNIYGLGDNGIWVDDFDNENFDLNLKSTITDMLDFIGVRKTSDKCSFTISDNPDFADDIRNGVDNNHGEDIENSEGNEDNKGAEENETNPNSGGNSAEGTENALDSQDLTTPNSSTSDKTEAPSNPGIMA